MTIKALKLFAGALLGFSFLLAMGELFLQRWPGSELLLFLGDESSLSGPFVSDPDIAVAYRSYHAFRVDNSRRVVAFDPVPDDNRPVWALFGNSFVHAPGMLADTARAAWPDVRIVNLGRNEDLPVRVAQVRLLLGNRFRPERIFFALLPIDLTTIARYPLATWHISRRGAITYRVTPPPLRALLESRLFLTHWVRTRRHQGNPHFHPRDLDRFVHPQIEADLGRLVAALAAAGRAANVKITILMIPNRQQILRDRSYAVQDVVVRIARREGVEIIDSRAYFRRQANRRELFIPDGHFSARGNAVLLDAIVDHLGRRR